MCIAASRLEQKAQNTPAHPHHARQQLKAAQTAPVHLHRARHACVQHTNSPLTYTMLVKVLAQQGKARSQRFEALLLKLVLQLRGLQDLVGLVDGLC